MLEIIPYTKDLEFKYDGYERYLTGEEVSEIINFYAKLGTVYAGKVEGEIIGVGGIYPLWNKMGSAFLFLNKVAVRHKIATFKALLKYTKELIDKYELETLTIDCVDGFLEARRLIRHLGFIKMKEVKTGIYTKKVIG